MRLASRVELPGLRFQIAWWQPELCACAKTSFNCQESAYCRHARHMIVYV